MKILFFIRNVYPMSMPIPFLTQIYALGNYADVKFYGPGFPNSPTMTQLLAGEKINVLEVISRLYGQDYPDVVVVSNPTFSIFEGGESLWGTLCNFELAKCLRVLWIGDIQNTFPNTKGTLFDYVNDHKVDLVLKLSDPKNELIYSKNLESAGVPVEWAPFSADQTMFYDMRLPKIYDVANIGVKTPETYPLRWKMQEVLSKQNEITYYPRQPTDICAGTAYARMINQTRIFATDSSLYQITLSKMFEAMACNTLLLTNTPREAEELGLKPNVNFAAIDDYPTTPEEVNIEKFMEPIRYYLSHPEEAKEIAQRGHDLVHSRHTDAIRIPELLAKLGEYL